MQIDEQSNCGSSSILEFGRPPSAARYSLIGRLPGGDAISMIPLDRDPFTVGRKANNGLSLSESTVSSYHAEISQTDAKLYVTDLDSTNGTFLNGKRITGTHPLSDGDLLQFGAAVFRVSSQTPSAGNATESYDATDDAAALVQFGQVLKNQGISPHLQPIIELDTGETTGFEVLARSRYIGLRSAAALFRAASRMNAEIALSQQARLAGMNVAKMVPHTSTLFLNTHPNEVADPGLIDSLRELRSLWPNRRMAIEIHESAVTNSGRLNELKAVLSELEMELAFDDFGSGQSRLKELIDVRPDYVKFDMSMFADPQNPSQRRAIETLVEMTLELDIVPLAEGVETQQQHEFCHETGFLLGQGFLFGRPLPVSLLVNQELRVDS